MKPRFKRYSLILLVLIIFFSAIVLLHYALPPPPEEGTVVLIHATERGEVRFAEGDEQLDPSMTSVWQSSIA